MAQNEESIANPLLPSEPPDPTLQRALLALQALPPLPQALGELTVVLNDGQASYAALGRVLGRDPALAARILGLANSAFYGRGGRVHTLEDAVRLLGLTLVRAVALGTVLTRHLNPALCPAFQPARFWLASLASALATHHLASFVTLEDAPSADLAYLGGLLHRLGLLALVHLRPREMASSPCSDIVRRARAPAPARDGL
ncbi:MAG: hypothetical protein B7Z74_10580, partial [Deltaproteobacteria bacterium 21-66-5]